MKITQEEMASLREALVAHEKTKRAVEALKDQIIQKARRGAVCESGRYVAKYNKYEQRSTSWQSEFKRLAKEFKCDVDRRIENALNRGKVSVRESVKIEEVAS